MNKRVRLQSVFWSVGLLLALALLFFFRPAAAAQTPYPQPYDLYINDYADVIKSADEAAIVAMFYQMRRDHGIEATVVTIDTTGSRSIESYATGLFNDWGIGDAAKNNGVLLLVAIEDREMRIEVGSGYGSSQNRVMKSIIDNDMLPLFRRGRFSEGIRAGATGIVTQLTGNVIQKMSWGARLASGFGVLVSFLGAGRVYLRRRPRDCPRCGLKMVRQSKFDARQRLSTGQAKEMLVGSVTHDVWACPGCDETLMVPYRNLLSRHGTCPECGFRTVEKKRRTMSAATYSSTGLDRITFDCQHCDYLHVRDVTTAQKTRNDDDSSGGSSWGSSGGSFGGGSSSGGGASGKW